MFTLFFALFCGIAVVVAIQQIHAVRTTQRTQASTPVAATVLTDRVIRHTHSRSPDTYTTDLVVLLPPGSTPDLAVAHVDSAVRGLEDHQVSVVLDPRDGGYAELAGRPYATSSDAVGEFVAVGIFAVFAVLGGLALGRTLTLRRRIRAARAASVST